MLGRPKLNLAGQKFGRLTVVDSAGTAKDGHTLWLCRCECGGYKTAKGNNLKLGVTGSCGCYQIECARQCITKLVGQRYEAGEFRPRPQRKTINVWRDMIRRCTNPKCQAYKDYGGRGITVCETWKTFAVFLKDMGLAPEGYWIERIDNNKGYSKNNCRWATQKEQSRNTRRTHFITYDGKTLCVAEWSEITGVNRHLIYARLKYGWSIPEALFTPPVPKRESGIRSAIARKAAA